MARTFRLFFAKIVGLITWETTVKLAQIFYNAIISQLSKNYFSPLENIHLHWEKKIRNSFILKLDGQGLEQEMEQKPWKNTVRCLIPHGLFSFLSG